VRSSTIFHPAPALAYRVEADGRALVYATDTEDAFSGKPNPVIDLAREANTLIHDGQFLPSDFKATWGHSTVDAAIDIAAKARVDRLVIYHHDPDRSDDALDQIGWDAQRAASARRPELEVVVAREGLELAI
jgi:ribonuclease BN (tRNA processing enzyme)